MYHQQSLKELSNLNIATNKKDEYNKIFEILISSNSLKSASEILDLFKKLVNKKYIEKEIFNDFLESGDFLFYIKKYLQHSQIDITDIKNHILS
ncbi:hypothetical protein AFAEC_0120 [Aliarcobacter faecis]|uniref:hypothetical protein n=1 Tax=Aliarcobacter faecis TaxID=1564138 RepID=UPI0004B06185|nr:hypothetical protein [Aliarcobacter faecis]QKF72342.1 hypothetical protein AFAEC_0120 [Aliarcobacter faecis]